MWTSDKIAELEGRLRQDPKDARWQLFKQTQQYAGEAERCTKRIAELEERLSASQIRTEQLEGSLELAKAENKRLCVTLADIRDDSRSGFEDCGCSGCYMAADRADRALEETK